MKHRDVITALLLSLSMMGSTQAQQKKFEANYDEAKIGNVVLPPICDKPLPGSPAEAKQAWEPRRAELLKLFADQMFGHAPTTPGKLAWKIVEEGEAFDGLAQRKQIRVTLSTSHGELPIDLLLYSPNKKSKPSMTFLGLNFRGNHGETNDPAVLLPSSWVTDTTKAGTSDGNKANEKGRGAQAHRLPVELIIGEGCAVATAYYGDIDPDFDDNFQNGVHALFPEHRSDEAHPDRWGSIAAWAWGLSRLLDVLEQQPEVDAKQVIVFGHSRLGKTSLWAGATDTRFAGVISNDSGAGGAALSKRIFGETVWRLNTSFPHWFCRNFRQYNEKEETLPFDQHQLLALIAPRMLHVASATEDLWADPRGEFLAAQAAAELYTQLGVKQSPLTEFPAPDAPILGTVSYHLRTGKHDLTADDWKHYLKSAKQVLKSEP